MLKCLDLGHTAVEQRGWQQDRQRDQQDVVGFVLEAVHIGLEVVAGHTDLAEAAVDRIEEGVEMEHHSCLEAERRKEDHIDLTVDAPVVDRRLADLEAARIGLEPVLEVHRTAVGRHTAAVVEVGRSLGVRQKLVEIQQAADQAAVDQDRVIHLQAAVDRIAAAQADQEEEHRNHRRQLRLHLLELQLTRSISSSN